MTQKVNVTDSERWREHLNAIAKQHDRHAFKALYLYFAPKIKSFYLQHGMGEKSEELTHEVFLKIWQKAASYDPQKASVSTWIFTIVRNLKIDFLRKKRIDEVNDENLPDPAEEANFSEKISIDRDKSRLLSVFNQLNEEQRNVLQKVYFEDKSHQIAAKELEMSPGVVKSRIRSALKILRAHIGGDRI
ncbi:RNA polymerase sigma factor [Aliikangiella coralliicola]|nr:sigma-70 family RNA polymerase sigma factor [Aliikangiella coralliicola]